MSRRFDGKDEHLKTQTPVGFSDTVLILMRTDTVVLKVPSAPSPTPASSSNATGDEAAAMAAMFKAQTDVWEETQEKMSQLVSDLSRLLMLLYNENTFFVLFYACRCVLTLMELCSFDMPSTSSVLLLSIVVLEVQVEADLSQEGKHTSNQIGRCIQATFAIDAV
jgi:hypothetical protein